MMDKKILVLSMSAWNSKVGSDTWATLLEGQDPDNIANIALREEMPDSKVCNNYFTISESRVLKSICNRKIKTGYAFDEINVSDRRQKDIEAHDKMYGGTKRNIYLKRMLREIVWALGKWKSDELKKFVDDFKPDVVLYFMDGYIHFNRICRYITKRANAKSIGFFVDDTFTYKQNSGLGFKLFRFFQRKSLHKLASKTDAFWAITDMTKSEADEEFGVDCRIITKPLRKSIQFEEVSIHKPITILYTGNLQIGRDKTLIKLVQAIKEMNSQDFVIDVYTRTNMSDSVLKELECDFCNIHSAVEQDKVFDLQRNADILLFLEDTDGEDAFTARLSFSTKIIDYLSCSKCILAIGNKDTAPMRYFEKNGAALIAQTTEEIKQRLREIVNNPDLISKTAYNAYECGVKNHSKEIVLQGVMESIEDLF